MGIYIHEKHSHKNSSTQLNSKDYVEMVHLYFHKLLFIQFSVEREENPTYNILVYVCDYNIHPYISVPYTHIYL